MLQYLYTRKNEEKELLRTVDSLKEFRSLSGDITSKVKILELRLEEDEKNLNLMLERFPNLETLVFSDFRNLEVFLSLNNSDSLRTLEVESFQSSERAITLTLGFCNFSNLSEFSLITSYMNNIIFKESRSVFNHRLSSLSICGAGPIKGLEHLRFLERLRNLSIKNCTLSSFELSNLFRNEEGILDRLEELTVAIKEHVNIPCISFEENSKYSAYFLQKLFLSNICIQNIKKLLDSAYNLSSIDLHRCTLEEEMDLSQHFKLERLNSYNCVGLNNIALDERNNAELKELIINSEVKIKGYYPYDEKLTSFNQMEEYIDKTGNSISYKEIVQERNKSAN